ncbi:MAG: response regulator [Planctomycetes bacterium]|nr:response regulator [Planctomycetota bacterium]
MERTRILVVDDDELYLRLVSTTLTEQGYDVVMAQDGVEALNQIKERLPDLIITDILMPKIDGHTLIMRFRTLPGSAYVPVIFLSARGSTEDRIYGFRLGADDYLPKPFHTEELVLRIAKALDRRRGIERSTRGMRAGRRTPGSSDLHGTLSELGFPSVLTLMDMERKSGILELRHPGRGETAALLIREGQVVQASVDGLVPMKNKEAIYYLAEWTTGRFAFTALPVNVPDEIKTPTAVLLMEAARRLDEQKGP